MNEPIRQDEYHTCYVIDVNWDKILTKIECENCKSRIIAVYLMCPKCERNYGIAGYV